MDIYEICHFCCSVGLIPIGGPGFGPLVKGQHHETETTGWSLVQTHYQLQEAFKGVCHIKVQPTSQHYTSLVHNIVDASQHVSHEHNGAAGLMASLKSQVKFKR